MLLGKDLIRHGEGGSAQVNVDDNEKTDAT